MQTITAPNNEKVPVWREAVFTPVDDHTERNLDPRGHIKEDAELQGARYLAAKNMVIKPLGLALHDDGSVTAAAFSSTYQYHLSNRELGPTKVTSIHHRLRKKKKYHHQLGEMFNYVWLTLIPYSTRYHRQLSALRRHGSTHIEIRNAFGLLETYRFDINTSRWEVVFPESELEAVVPRGSVYRGSQQVELPYRELSNGSVMTPIGDGLEFHVNSASEAFIRLGTGVASRTFNLAEAFSVTLPHIDVTIVSPENSQRLLVMSGGELRVFEAVATTRANGFGRTCVERTFFFEASSGAPAENSTNKERHQAQLGKVRRRRPKRNRHLGLLERRYKNFEHYPEDFSWVETVVSWLVLVAIASPSLLICLIAWPFLMFSENTDHLV